MNVITAAKFDKDVDKINDETVREKIADVIDAVILAQRPSDIQNIKKMKGTKNAFRIRVGNYRIGVLIENDTVKFARVALRKDIYDIFP
jgi:mRNA interferase RelE/StbE